ncbi:hypothetical protein PTSG_10466 [Salpingoeca rosetta]|uniref:Ubiquitin-like domain-containing protein n=1 Tax=Salpingoeca rosetta (strain ATCC 50818 / BSB-021) TaxID=946362 RepID=F2UPR4_SALR5|nr:uncharacterized protein PTSG_10466 [Salpingoeca rosetta]EGD79619.1 hypothetical protein PTSG_10466 [Salpingoeca rosetta]|eukprot:XP_004988847.1 hypothetical protein PTSG_10466 [Salpingoeca rosetta]
MAGKKKGGKKKGGKKKKAAEKKEKGNLVPGMVAGGMPLTALTPQGRSIEVAELRFATVKSLKNQISEAGQMPADTMRLFVQVAPTEASASGSGVRCVKDIEGYKPDWKWERSMLVKELHDDWTLEMSGLRPTNMVYLLRKLPALQTLSPFHPARSPACTCHETSGPSTTPKQPERNTSAAKPPRKPCPVCDGKTAVERFREQVLPKPPPPLVLRNSVALSPAAHRASQP